jgi:hypothetical protein
MPVTNVCVFWVVSILIGGLKKINKKNLLKTSTSLPNSFKFKKK